MTEVEGDDPSETGVAGSEVAPQTDIARDDGERGPQHGKRRRVYLALAGALLLLVGGSLFAALSNTGTTVLHPLVDETNGPAPSFSLQNLSASSRPVSLGEFQGKDLVVNFWASWCYPCRTEMPLLESAYRSDHGKVAFLGIDTNDSRSDAQRFLNRTKVTYPSGFDPDEKVGAEYGLFGLPVTVFISSSGKLKGRHIGQLDGATLQAALQKAFGTAASS